MHWEVRRGILLSWTWFFWWLCLHYIYWDSYRHHVLRWSFISHPIRLRMCCRLLWRTREISSSCTDLCPAGFYCIGATVNADEIRDLLLIRNSRALHCRCHQFCVVSGSSCMAACGGSEYCCPVEVVNLRMFPPDITVPEASCLYRWCVHRWERQ